MTLELAQPLLMRSLFGNPLPPDHGPYMPAQISLAEQVVSNILLYCTLPVLGACLTRRIGRVRKWTALPVSAWLLLGIYADSLLYLLTTALLKDIGLNESVRVCDGGILLCIVCYMSTKVLIYTFLVEKVWVVRGCLQRRLESKLYLFNCFGMLLPYAVFVVLSLIWRIGYIDENGMCIIGAEKRAMVPLVIFEFGVNLYLNILFIIPLRKMYSFQHGNGKMRVLAFRTFIGSCATLFTSITNLTVLMAVGGEPAWLCLMLCNVDILFCVLILHWATKFDSGGSTTSGSCSHPSHGPIATTLPIAQPEPAKRCGMFSYCEENFPEDCWKAHPWVAANSPKVHPCSMSTSKCASKEPPNELKPINTEESEESQIGIERALKSPSVGPSESGRARSTSRQAREAGKC